MRPCLVKTTAGVLGLIAALGGVGALAESASAQEVIAVPFATGLTRPNFLITAPGNSDTLYVLEQPGKIQMLDRRGNILGTFLDLTSVVSGGTGGETGLLGLAFASDYQSSGLFYVNYTRQVTGQLTTVVEEFTRGSDGLADLNSAQRIIQYTQPFSNHNGGWIGFGPDGNLYIATGDGGSGDDPQNNASDLTVLLGKMLRIDVSDDNAPYQIPPTNPFIAPLAARDEIWAYGLRNPWRCSFDRVTGDLWIADVGQDRQEEINLQPADSAGGEHYGWRCREGNRANSMVTGCPDENPLWVNPVRVYAQGQTGRCSITGGYVYRGCAMPELYGEYFYGDFCTGEIWSHNTETNIRTLRTTVNSLTSFGEDEQGELYAVSLNGQVFRLLPSDPGGDANADGVPDTCECPAEFNGDGILDHGDIGAFVTSFIETDSKADLNGDGVIDNADITVFVRAFIETCG